MKSLLIISLLILITLIGLSHGSLFDWFKNIWKGNTNSTISFDNDADADSHRNNQPNHGIYPDPTNLQPSQPLDPDAETVAKKSKAISSILYEQYRMNKQIVAFREVLNKTFTRLNVEDGPEFANELYGPFSTETDYWNILLSFQDSVFEHLTSSLNATKPFIFLPHRFLVLLSDSNGKYNETYPFATQDYYRYLYYHFQSIQSQVSASLDSFQKSIIAQRLLLETAEDNLKDKKFKFIQTNDTSEPAEQEGIAKFLEKILQGVSDAADQVEKKKPSKNIIFDENNKEPVSNPNGSKKDGASPEKTLPKIENGKLETVVKIKPGNNTQESLNDYIPTLVDISNNYYVLSKPADLTGILEDNRFLHEIFLLISVSYIFGVVASLLRLPAFLGWIGASILLGPGVMDQIRSIIQIGTLSQLGAFVMLFNLGLEFSVDKLREVWKPSAFCALALALELFFAFILFKTWIGGISLIECSILAVSLSLSSTAVTLQCIKGDSASKKAYTKTLIGVLVVQDIILCLFLAFFPLITGEEAVASGAALPSFHDIVGKRIGMFALKAIASLVSCWVISRFLMSKIVPKLLLYYPGLVSLSALVFALSVGMCFGYFELSVELGCFVAGVILSSVGEEEAHRIADCISPIYGLFSIFFFNSIGLHVSPQFLISVAGTLFILSLAITIVKFTLVYLNLKLFFRFDNFSALNIAAGLAQISEFAFVLGSKAKVSSQFSREAYYILVGMTSLCLLIGPIGWNLLSKVLRYIDSEKDESSFSAKHKKEGRNSFGSEEEEGILPSLSASSGKRNDETELTLFSIHSPNSRE